MLTLPITKCISGALFSVLRVKVPASSSFFFNSGLGVKVPFLGLGIKPFGPKILANLANLGINSGAAKSTSKSILPFSTSANT